MKIDVPPNKFEKSFRIFKKKVEEEGILKEVRRREHYVKPNIDRKVKKAAAIKRWQKYLERNTLPKKHF
jgi:small subunit ribosomal protein S21